MLHWAIPFLIYAGEWKASSLGVCQKHFPRESGTKVVFPRGSGQVFQRGQVSFPQGSYLENWFPKGDFWCHPLEFLFVQAQKCILKIAFHTPVWKKMDYPIFHVSIRGDIQTQIATQNVSCTFCFKPTHPDLKTSIVARKFLLSKIRLKCTQTSVWHQA